MKHIALAWTFAAALAAQGHSSLDPKAELAAVIAVEEQERDLARAEAMYRELLAGTKLSPAARAAAGQRLGRLLKKLGRDQEAAPFLQAGQGAAAALADVTEQLQGLDAEREKALREKARAIVQQVLEDQTENWKPPLYGIANPALAEQLLWIGEAAVPEVIAALQAEAASLPRGRAWHRARQLAVQGLAGFLWRIGGTLSAAFLASCSKIDDVAFRQAIVATAFQAEQPAMLAEAARFLDDRDPEGSVVKTLLSTNGGGVPLSQRLPRTQIVEAALRGPLAGKIRMLQWAVRQAEFDEATLARVLELVQEGLRSADPAFGTAASQFLLSGNAQASTAGMLLVLQELPRMRGLGAPRSRAQPPRIHPHLPKDELSRFSAEQALRLVPAIDACSLALGEGGEDVDERRRWLRNVMVEVAAAAGEPVVPAVLAWMDRGHDVWFGIRDHITAANSRHVFERFDRVEPQERRDFLSRFAGVDLPSDLFPLLRDKAGAAGDQNAIDVFATVVGQTGNPDAADWLLTLDLDVARVVPPLLALGRRTQAENVRAAMRKVVVLMKEGSDDRRPLLLALLSMHDASALDLVGEYNRPGTTSRPVPHPYAGKDSQLLPSPLHYLVTGNPTPPHGFTEDEVIQVLRKIAAKRIPSDWRPPFWSHSLIADRVLGEIASLCAAARARSGDEHRDWQNWISLACERERAAAGTGPLAGWTAGMLGHASPAARAAVLAAMTDEDGKRLQPAVEACIDDADDEVRSAAVRRLYGAGLLHGPQWLARLLRHADPAVNRFAIDVLAYGIGEPAAAGVLPLTKSPDSQVRRQAAVFLGSVVSKDAVPSLIELLRDADEGVRAAAAEALTRIRFFHEQQAHWDRVLKGLDATPASAAEKLLLQAKPGAGKEQRLLAITSLGTLGVPEALPFLIEWTQDPDVAIAAAARAAITQIHLQPRR